MSRPAPHTRSRQTSLTQAGWKRFRSGRTNRFCLWLLKLVVIIALLADFLANDKPIFAVHEGKAYFPVIKDYLHDLGISKWEKGMVLFDWKTEKLDHALWPPVRYAGAEVDTRNQRRRGPFEEQRVKNWKYWHYLGTDSKGHDVLAGLIHGARVSLTIGIFAMGIAAIVGIFFGALAGYFGDHRLRMSRAGMILLILSLPLAWFWGFSARSYPLQDAFSGESGSFLAELALSILIFAGVIGIFQLPGILLKKLKWAGKRIPVKMDLIITRIIELVIAIPAILILVSISGLLEPGQESIYITMAVLGLMGWPGIARFTRAEMLRVRNLDYIQAAQAAGFTEVRIILRHALPNTLGPVLITIAFGIAGAILAESALSYLGLGVPYDTATWGALLADARQDVDAWWLVLFPGLAIFATVMVFNLLGEGIRNAVDPKLQD